MNAKSSTKCCAGCRCCSSNRSPPKVTNFRYQGFRSTPAITPAIPKPETTRNQFKIQPHPKWNSSVQLATKPPVTLPGTKKTLEDLRLVQPFQAKPVPESTYKPFRPILSKDRTSVMIDRRNRKTLQELANKEMSIKENNAIDFKPNPFRAKLLPASTYKPFRPVLSKDRQPAKRRTAVMKKPMVLESPGGNDAIESTSAGVEQHFEVNQMPAGKIREPIKDNISIAAEEGNNGEEEPDKQPPDDDVEVPVLLDEEEMVPGENVDPDVEESETMDENQEYSEEPAKITEESEIIEEQETADEEPDNGDEVLLNEVVDAPPIPEI